MASGEHDDRTIEPGSVPTVSLRFLVRGRQRAQGLMRDLLRPQAPDLTSEQGRGRERSRRAALSSLAGISSRLISILLSLVTIPILLRYLGVERYGIWLTIWAGAAWLGVLQFGVAPSLLNQLSAVEPTDVHIRKVLVSTAWWLAVLLAVIALLPLAFLYFFASWSEILNVPPGALTTDGRSVAALVWIGVAAGMPLSVPIAILRARQEGYIANAIEVTGGLVRLTALIVLVATNAGMAGLALGLTVAGIGVSTVGAAWVFRQRSPALGPSVRQVDRAVGASLLRTGTWFTALGIAALVISYTDLIVISHVLGPASVPAYAISFSLLGLFVGIELAILDAIWPAFGESAARGDRRWLEATHRRVVSISVAGATAFGALFVAFGQPVIRLWAGEEVVPPVGLLIVLGGLALIQAYELPHSRMLMALGHVRTNSLLGLANAAVNLPLSIIFAMRFGIIGVALGTLVGYIVVGGFLVVRARRALDEVRQASSPELQALSQVAR
jgi:O-antigen/teichoic acid export membrane protein